ncbi:hypothetical protein [Nocardia vaccinii]|uniref:hypothetical protein n=1 Tax=Nocardia vaccinii TaxID=1822 RepID=UPI0012F494B1|nr:hypothetical protein [Nocardia vaccinii]
MPIDGELIHKDTHRLVNHTTFCTLAPPGSGAGAGAGAGLTGAGAGCAACGAGAA